ncbi:MAG: hypothetical protein ACKOA8_09435, partial [Deltaproteobacteria bacterium]
MSQRVLSVCFGVVLLLISACGKDEVKPSNPGPSPSNPNPAPSAPTNPSQPASNNNCYCDECGCYILYSDGSYQDVDSCGYQQQPSYPQQNNYPQQNYGYPQQNNYP